MGAEIVPEMSHARHMYLAPWRAARSTGSNVALLLEPKNKLTKNMLNSAVPNSPKLARAATGKLEARPLPLPKPKPKVSKKL